MSSVFSFIFEFNLLNLCLFDWDEPEVYEWLKLHIRGWLECMQKELELLIMTLCLYFDNIMEVTFGVSLEGNVHFNSKTSCKWSLHIMFN